MKKILTVARITELGDTALRLVELFKNTASLHFDAFLSKNFTEIEQLALALTAAVKRDQALSQLEEADAHRDNAIRVLDRLLKGYEHIPLAELKEHAQKLLQVFRKYGVKITEENYTSQSNLIMSMLEDFSASSLKVSIEALQGVKEAIAQIKTTQDAFANVRKEYESALANQKEKASASSIRKPLLELINKKMIPYLVAMEIAQPELFKEFVAKASEIINSTNDAVKARAKKEKK